jgi:hypothetical protein
MATSNFHNVNASKIFVVLTNYETPILDEDGEETDEMESRSPEDWECLEFIDYLSEKIAESKNSTNYSKESEHELRSYPSTHLHSLAKHKTYNDVEVEVFCHAYLRSAYYEGASLDWETEIKVNGYESSINDLEEDFGYQSENKGLAKIHSRNALKWSENALQELIDEMETIFESVSETYQVVARFSNGETMYKKC